MNKSRNRMLFKITVLGLFCSLLFSCGREEDFSNLRPVEVMVVERTKNPSVLVFTGFAKPSKSINVSFRVRGLIEELPIKVGMELRKGDLIAKLQSEDYQLELDQAIAARERAEAEARNATAQYRRTRALYETESVSRNELDSARAAHEAARAAVKRTETAVDLAEKQLSYTILKSDYDRCLVSSVKGEENENVSAGQEIAEIFCGSEIDVEIAVPEGQVSLLQKEDPVLVQFNTLPELMFKGKISEVGVVAPVGTTFPVTVALQEPDPRIRPGMAARVFFVEKSNQSKMIFLLPLDAVQEDQDGHYVYIYQKNTEKTGIAKKRKVIVKDVNPNGIEIGSGIEEGEKVIIAGVRYLHDGKRVRLSPVKVKKYSLEAAE